MDAPYARIAAELRRRITSGELAAGERVPSTRELMREWDVAMATATKALTTLRQEGLVRPVPGVGTVVEGVNRRAAPARPRSELGLGAEQIVAAAIAIADAEGVAALSMRRVAADIGVATMSLYRHVADKDDLVVRMTDAVLHEIDLPAAPPTGWRPRVELAATAMWAAMRRHPWFAAQLSLTRPEPVAGGIAYTEFVLSAFVDTGVDITRAFFMHLTLFNFLRGAAINLEAEVEAEAATGIDKDKWMDQRFGKVLEIVTNGQHPTMHRMLAKEMDVELDALVESGMVYLLDGMEAAVRRLR
ncbi:GntR family transcriptional regulator [Pseudonocardia sp. TRM90224]|uniref:GntR family transcriptional regulator n=1 Tax=Pseudonocardia sp. TRM90224 TaxID=2812678 RepID=UPI001E51CF01|nr:GntR family transcriptional regulator [Pseudonocardia sp. TRM90224]